VATDVRGVFTFKVHGGLVECGVYNWGEELGANPLLGKRERTRTRAQLSHGGCHSLNSSPLLTVSFESVHSIQS
jgi:hypothetical protein